MVLERKVEMDSNISGLAKVQPSKEFLQPLCQILVAQLSYLWHSYVRKIPKIDINYVILQGKQGKKNFAARI
jgi:hypothetical protein